MEAERPRRERIAPETTFGRYLQIHVAIDAASHLHQNENESINIDYNLCSDDRETVDSSPPNALRSVTEGEREQERKTRWHGHSVAHIFTVPCDHRFELLIKCVSEFTLFSVVSVAAVVVAVCVMPDAFGVSSYEKQMLRIAQCA